MGLENRLNMQTWLEAIARPRPQLSDPRLKRVATRLRLQTRPQAERLPQTQGKPRPQEVRLRLQTSRPRPLTAILAARHSNKAFHLLIRLNRPTVTHLHHLKVDIMEAHQGEVTDLLIQDMDMAAIHLKVVILRILTKVDRMVPRVDLRVDLQVDLPVDLRVDLQVDLRVVLQVDLLVDLLQLLLLQQVHPLHRLLKLLPHNQVVLPLKVRFVKKKKKV